MIALNIPAAKTFFLILLLQVSIAVQRGYAVNETPGVIKPEHRAELKVLKDNAQSKALQNLNRYAIENLERYDVLLDTFSTREVRDSLAILESEYNRSTAGRKDTLAKLRFSIEELTNAKASNHRRYNNLLRKAGIAFGTWFLIVLLLLQIRKKRLRKQSSVLKDSNIKLQASQNRAELGKKLLSTCSAILSHLKKIHSSVSDMTHSIRAHVASSPNTIEPDKLKAITDNCTKLENLTGTELRICEFITTTLGKPSTDKIQIDINSVCESALEIATRGTALGIPAEILTVSKDLEKNLPKISVLPERVHAMLLNILNNAFQAVQQKHLEGIKGYQPKVVLSTRILPRFLQIRIKDNGNGIPKTDIDKVLEEFYSTRPLHEGTGLGFSDSLQLFGESLKGELKLESDPGNGTDVYIKFFL
ncbi:MAG: hypothetical protein KA444_01640 [Bacteroidia bacterium]|nr:hypothetical protein [Bacteroidia bacterium]